MMWTRAEIKERAKKALSGNYGKAFVVSLIIAFTGGSHNGGGGGGAGGTSGANSTINNGFFNQQVILIIGMVLLFVLLLRILIGYVLEVGGRKFFIKLSEGEAEFRNLGYGFRENRYLPILMTMFLRSIYLFLWFLLLFIPGIIKIYAYRMVPYILADNPEIGYNRAIELSNEMTRGEKFNIFILDLSFIGWYLLGALALGIGVLFVQPYYDSTNAELYLKLRQHSVEKGLTTKEELKLYQY